MYAANSLFLKKPISNLAHKKYLRIKFHSNIIHLRWIWQFSISVSCFQCISYTCMECCLLWCVSNGFFKSEKYVFFQKGDNIKRIREEVSNVHQFSLMYSLIQSLFQLLLREQLNRWDLTGIMQCCLLGLQKLMIAWLIFLFWLKFE